MSKLIKFGKRALTISVAGTMIVWSLGLAALAPAQAATLVAGDLIKASGPAVYYYTSDGKRAPFPNDKVFSSWYVGFGSVKTITDAELAAIPLSGTNMTYRAGTRLVKITTDPKVYAVEPGGSLRWVNSEEVAKALYGDNWNKQIDDVPDVFFTNYSKGSDVSSAKPTVGSLFKTADSSDIYYQAADGARKLADLTAFDANGFQSKFVRTVAASVKTTAGTSASGELKGKETAVALPTFAAPSEEKKAEEKKAEEVAGKAMLKVEFADDNPAGAVHASGTSYNKVLSLKLTATEADATLTSLTLTRGGLSSDTSLTGVAVFAHQATMRHGTFATFSNNKATVSMSNEPVKIKKGETVPLWVKVNINSGAAGQSGTYTLGVAAAADFGTTATVSGVFPLTSSTFSMTSGASTVGTLTVDTVRVHNNGAADGTNVTVNMGTTNQDTGRFRFAAGANEDMVLTSLALYNNGNTVDADLANIDLVGPDGAVLATVAAQKDKYVTFDLSKIDNASDTNGYLIPKGATRDLLVREDLVSGASRSIRWLFQNDYDIEGYGASSKAGILATLVGGNTAPTGSDRAFPIGDQDGGAGTNYANRITIASGTLSLTKATTSPTGNIPAGGTLVQLGKWEVKATGEDMELRQVSYRVNRLPAVAANNLTGTFTVQIQEAGATSSPTTIFTVAGSAATYEAQTNATLTTYPTLKANTTYNVTFSGDIASTVAAGVTYSTVLDVVQVFRKNSNDVVDPGTAVSAANTLTVSTGTLTVAANNSQPPITVVQNQSTLATFGSWTFTAGPAEPITLNSVTIDDNTAGLGRNFKELELWVGGVKKSQDNSSTIAPTATTATVVFNISPSYELAAGQTVVVELKGRVLTATMDATVITQIPASGVSGSGKTSLTSLSTIPAVNTNAQTVTIAAAGTLGVSRDTVTNVRSSQLVAGTTGVTFGAFKFQTTNTEGIKIRKIYLSNAGSNTNGLTNIGIYESGSTSPIGSITKASLGSDTLVTGGDEKSVVFDYTGLSNGGYSIPKNTFKVLLVKGDTVYAATAGQTARLVVAEVEGEGEGSGTRVYTTLSGDALTGDVAGQAYAVGDVVSINDASALSADQDNTMVTTTALASGAASNVAGTPFDAFTLAAADHLSKWNKISTETVNAGATAQSNYTTGDVIVASDLSANTHAFYVVTSTVAQGADLGTANALANGLDLDAADVFSRISSGASEALSAASTLTYKAGDVVVVNDTGDADDGIYVVGTAVNPGTDITAASGLVNGYTFAAGRVTKLPVITSELASTSAAYAYRAGDVVVVHDDSATTDDGLFVFPAAVAVGGDLTATTLTGTALTTSDRVSRLAVVQTNDNLKRLYPTKLNFAWTAAAGGSVLSTGGQVEVGRFTMGADTANAANPDAAITVTNLAFTQIASARLTNATLHDYTLNTNLSTNVTPDNAGGTLTFSGLSTSFTHGESRTFRVLADVGSNAGSQSVQYRFNAGSDTSAGTATWNVSATGQTTVTGVTWTVLATDSTDTSSAQMTASSVASDAITPSISTVGITDAAAGNDALAAADSILITFSEKIDPSSVASTLRYGTGTVAATAGATGTVSGAENSGGTNACGVASANDTINVANIACISLGNGTAITAGVAAQNTTLSLNAAGTALTIALTGALALNANDGAEADGGELLTAVRDAAGNLLAASTWTITALDL